MINERIKKFAEKSNVKPLYSSNGFGPRYIFEEDELKKFMELIVKECAEVAACNGHVSGFALGDVMNEHFGVEE